MLCVAAARNSGVASRHSGTRVGSQGDAVGDLRVAQTSLTVVQGTHLLVSANRHRSAARAGNAGRQESRWTAHKPEAGRKRQRRLDAHNKQWHGWLLHTNQR